MNKEKIMKQINKIKLATSLIEKLLQEEDENTCGGLEQVLIDELEEINKKDTLTDFFEQVWKFIPSTPYDVKRKVTKDTKIRLQKAGLEKVKSACELYLSNQKPEYRYKRDRFFNDIIWNYLDNVKEEIQSGVAKSNFNFKGF